MPHTMLSLVEDAPPGFEFRPHLTRREVRRDVFALFAPSPEAAEQALGPLLERSRGLVVCESDSHGWSLRPSGLYHLDVPSGLRENLVGVVEPCLHLLARLQAMEDADAERALLLKRAEEDSARLVREFTAYRAGLVKEIEERRVAEKALRESEERFRVIFESVNEGILINDMETGQILHGNRRSCEMFGWSGDELRTMTLEELGSGEPPYTGHDAITWIRRAARGEPQVFEWSARNRSGHLFWVEIHMRSAVIGGQPRVLLTLRDITDRKRSEREMQRLNAELEQRVRERTLELEGANAELLRSNTRLETAQAELERSLEEVLRAKESADAGSRAKSEFLAMMSHEIRTPINGVMGMLTLLSDTALAVDQREMAQAAMESAEVLLGVLNDILDFSRIEARKLTFDELPFDLLDVVHEVRRILSPAAHKKSLDLCVLYHETAPRHMVGDASRIRQVLVNLVGNAIKFTSRGQVLLRVEPGEPGEPGEDAGEVSAIHSIYLAVEDTGIGISDENLTAIFDRFTQADPGIARKYGGTGLGLAICRELVRGMGGTIGATSCVGRGSTFWVRLRLPSAAPISEAGEARVRQGPPLSSLPAQPACPWARRVLVAEDNEINQRLAVHMLEKLGCRVDTAADGEEALQKLQQRPYDIVFMDCQMPELDGFEATAILRRREAARGARTPVIAMTAQAMKGDRERCLEAGMDDYMSKPLSRAVLADLVERWAPTSASPSSPRLGGERGTEADSSLLLDPSVLESLICLVDRQEHDFLKGLDQLFRQDTRNRLRAMRQALQDRNGASLAREAGEIRVSCKHLGARRMGDLCQCLQDLGLSGHLEGGLALLESLERDAERTEGALRAFMASHLGESAHPVQ